MTNALDLAISPDGAWIAYSSADALINDIYLQAFPPRGEKWRVSLSGGVDPHWSHDGRELFFVVAGNLMVVPFDGNPARLPRPTVLFSQVLPGPSFVYRNRSSAFWRGAGQEAVPDDHAAGRHQRQFAIDRDRELA